MSHATVHQLMVWILCNDGLNLTSCNDGLNLTPCNGGSDLTSFNDGMSPTACTDGLNVTVCPSCMDSLLKPLGCPCGRHCTSLTRIHKMILGKWCSNLCWIKRYDMISLVPVTCQCRATCARPQIWNRLQGNNHVVFIMLLANTINMNAVRSSLIFTQTKLAMLPWHELTVPEPGSSGASAEGLAPELQGPPSEAWEQTTWAQWMHPRMLYIRGIFTLLFSWSSAITLRTSTFASDSLLVRLTIQKGHKNDPSRSPSRFGGPWHGHEYNPMSRMDPKATEPGQAFLSILEVLGTKISLPFAYCLAVKTLL